jgi:NAD dependent epimerase/dehydratase family enzyme
VRVLIHRLDWVEMIRWIVQTPSVSGPVNATAPHPVTNRHLARALGHAMRRPSVLPTPGFALKSPWRDGELHPDRPARPARTRTERVHFRYPEIEQAFRGSSKILNKGKARKSSIFEDLPFSFSLFPYLITGKRARS